MSSSIPEEFASVVTVEQTIVSPIATLSTMYFLYGLYVLLFGTYIYTTRKRQQANESHNEKLYLTLAIVLFTLSTIAVAGYTRYYVVHAIVRFNAVRTQDYDPSLGILLRALLNMTADFMLIHRCYLIWGSRKRVGLPLIIIAVLVNVLGVIGSILITIAVTDTSIDSNFELYWNANVSLFAHQISSAFVNSVITLLTAGRIWWFHRQVHAHGSQSSDMFVDSVLRIILESGILYPALMIASLITVNVAPTSPAVDLAPVVSLAAGIAPTLIMVRAKLGKNIEELHDQISDICFTSRPAPREGIQTQVHSVVKFSAEVEDVRESRMTNGKEDNIA